MQELLLHYYEPALDEIGKLVRGQAQSWTTPEDVMQETMFEACRRIGTLEYRGQEAFFGWLMTIARTRLLNMIDKRRALKRGEGKSHLNPVLENTVATILQVLQGDDPTPSRVVRKKEAINAAQKALEKIDPDKREIIELRLGLGLQFKEIAERLGKKESAVKMAFERAMPELKRLMEANGEYTSGV